MVVANRQNLNSIICDRWVCKFVWNSLLKVYTQLDSQARRERSSKRTVGNQTDSYWKHHVRDSYCSAPIDELQVLFVGGYAAPAETGLASSYSHLVCERCQAE